MGLDPFRVEVCVVVHVVFTPVLYLFLKEQDCVKKRQVPFPWALFAIDNIATHVKLFCSSRPRQANR